MTVLDIDLNLIGRKTKPVTCEVERELTGADIEMLSHERGIQPTTIKKLRDSHHSLARLIAKGMKGHEISLVTGYTESRISTLKSDPAFQDLIEFYRQNDIEIAADLTQRLLNVALDATQEVHERLQDSPEVIPLEDLQSLIKLAADRTGYGPKSTNVNVNVDLSDRIRAARQRLEGAEAPRLVQGETIPGPPSTSLPAPSSKETSE